MNICCLQSFIVIILYKQFTNCYHSLFYIYITIKCLFLMFSFTSFSNSFKIVLIKYRHLSICYRFLPMYSLQVSSVLSQHMFCLRVFFRDIKFPCSLIKTFYYSQWNIIKILAYKKCTDYDKSRWGKSIVDIGKLKGSTTCHEPVTPTKNRFV